eukprot:gene12408-6075_t
MNWSKEETEKNVKAALKLSTNTFKIPHHFSFYKDDLYFLSNVDGTNTLCSIPLTKKGDIHKIEIVFKQSLKKELTKEEILLRERTRTLATGITDYSINKENILFTKGTCLFLYSIETKEIKDLTENNDSIQYPKSSKMDSKFSPDGKYISYICCDDIFILNLKTLKETRLTNSEKNKKSGVAEFIMQEEFDRYTGYWWNKSNNNEYQIVFLEIDESDVPILKISENGRERNCEEYKYPRPGDKNVKSKLKLIKFKNEDKIKEMNLLLNDHEQDVLWYEYITRVGWENDNIWVELLNREQNLKRIIKINENEEIKMIHQDVSDIWINISDLKIFFKDGIRSIIGSENDGFMHLYLINKNEIKQLTKGEYVVKQVWLDEKKEDVYFTSTKDTVLETHLYHISLKNENKIKRITKLGYNYNSFKFNQNFTSISCSYSSINEYPKSVVLSKNDDCDWFEGDFIDFSFQEIETPFKLTKPTIFNFKNTSNDIIYGSIYKQEGVSVPTILYIYQGPNVQLIKNDYSLYSNGRLQILSSLGYNIVMIDGRGSFNRGLKFEGILKNKMGQVELLDQIEGLNYLIKNENVDKNRIGIHGWSYGGYMSLMALSQYPNYFKIGISGAPVTEWELYDTGYTERYMGTPKSNEQGYKLGSVLNYSHNFPDEDDRLFLIHGSSDENVHFKHSEILISDLIKKGKPFKLGLYPGERHGLRQFHSTVYYYKELIKFISKNL